jgi:DNA segregation ATPase FtsK/SpoIIIE-like protein
MPKDYQHVRRATVVKNPSGQEIKLGGYRPDKQNPRDKKFSSRDRNLPSSVDLREYLTPVENQGNSNSCTANAMAGAYEYLANRLMGQGEDVSRLFIYYNARELDGDTSQDEGTYLRSCVRVLRKYGACSENTWSFNLKRIHDQPGDRAYQEAAKFKIKNAYRVEVDLQAMRSSLAKGYPFAFGLQLFSSFQQAGSNGLVPMPDPDNESHDGGHAMLCVGYSDDDQVFIVRNSWGEDWGDCGYCYIPYDYMTKPDYNGDCWAVRQISDVDFSQGVRGKSGSLFSGKKAKIAAAFQRPGAAQNPEVISLFEKTYEVEYTEQLVYVAEQGYVSVDEYSDLESLYYLEYEEEYETEEEYEAFELSIEEYSEEIEYSYEESEESEEEYSETESTHEESEEESEEYEEEESEEIEDSYEESEEEESEEEESEEYEEEESEEIEDSYEESEEEESEEEESEEKDSYEESEEESEEIEDSYEESEEESEEEESEEIEDSYEESGEEEYAEESAGDEVYEGDDGGDQGYAEDEE